jgi:hypothetical protein
MRAHPAMVPGFGLSVGRPLCTISEIFNLLFAAARLVVAVQQVNDCLWAPVDQIFRSPNCKPSSSSIEFF